MKAAVLHAFGEAPRYAEFPDPLPGPGDAEIEVRAVALENFDRAVASGTHYASRRQLPSLPAVLGHGGIGVRDDGVLIGFGGLRPPYGAMAERAVAPRAYGAPIPEGVDPAVAAALPSSALTALLPLRYGAALEAGETVLVQGATGFSGRLAVQVAKLLGAGRVVGSGRDASSLRSLPDLGADAVVDLTRADVEVVDAFRREAGDEGYGVVLDALWGHPTELLLRALTPDQVSFADHHTRLIQVGVSAGQAITLLADALRTSGLHLQGAGEGLTQETVVEGTAQVWDWIREGRLEADLERVPLRDVERAWGRRDLHGRRLVIVP
ncbi:MAG: quinone oxidoreductase family protein [Candidatus Dormibacteraceae bacterium]